MVPGSLVGSDSQRADLRREPSEEWGLSPARPSWVDGFLATPAILKISFVERDTQAKKLSDAMAPLLSHYWQHAHGSVTVQFPLLVNHAQAWPDQ